jgi:preprotein translocase subunit YajC
MFQLLNNANAQESKAPKIPAGEEALATSTSATASPTPAGAAPQPSAISMLMPFALMFVVIYFFMIRPQQKKMKEHQAMLGSIKNGDDVLTSSGILGRIAGITDKFITLEVSENVKIKVLKSQIAQIVKDQKELA